MIETPAALLNARATDAMDRWKLVFLFMAVTSLGYFVVQLDVSIVNLSLPAIQDYYRLTVSELQWIVNAYTLSFSIILLSAGVLGVRYGNKNFLILGYAIFVQVSPENDAIARRTFVHTHYLAAHCFNPVEREDQQDAGSGPHNRDRIRVHDSWPALSGAPCTASRLRTHAAGVRIDDVWYWFHTAHGHGDGHAFDRT